MEKVRYHLHKSAEPVTNHRKVIVVSNHTVKQIIHHLPRNVHSKINKINLIMIAVIKINMMANKITNWIQVDRNPLDTETNTKTQVAWRELRREKDKTERILGAAMETTMIIIHLKSDSHREV